MEQEKRFAILIDSDNVSPKYIDSIINEVSNYGNITYKRIYGDWTNIKNNSWKDVLLRTSVSPIQQYSYTTGKNATDSAMIIDAMDILYTGNVEGFCIVSSDSDFTKLAVRLRESGMLVIGMGERKTPKPFTTACNIFKYIDILSKEEEDDDDESTPAISMTDETKIRSAIVNLISDVDNTKGMDISELGNRIIKTFPDFDVRNYGYSKLSTYLATLDAIRLEREGKKVTAFPANNFKAIEGTIIELVKYAQNKTINMGDLNNKLLERFPNLNLRSFGYTKFQNLLLSIPDIYIIPNTLNVTLRSK